MPLYPATACPHHRRFSGYDYSRGAAVFATVCTELRRAIFGDIRDGAMVFSDFGRIAESALQEAAAHFHEIALHSHVVMPDHVHLRLHVPPGLPEPVRTFGAFIGRFKQFSQWRIRQAGGLNRIWEKGYHDHLCLSRQMIDAVDRYIANNPLKWWLMHGDRSLLHVREPLAEPWLTPDVFWRGVGRFEMHPENRLVSLRVSRRIPEREIPAVVETCVRGAQRGYCYISTFFSPGEHAVYRAVAEQTSAPMIHLCADAIAWGYRPTGLEPELFATGRLLALARMEASDAPADRASLLWLNEKAREIATATGGVAVYARVEGGKIVY